MPSRYYTCQGCTLDMRENRNASSRVGREKLGFILPGNYPDYRGNYPYSPILVRYHQNNGNAVTLSAHWVTSCIRGNYPWPNDKIKMTMATRTTIDLSFGKETIPIDVQTTSIDDWPHRDDGLVATGAVG